MLFVGLPFVVGAVTRGRRWKIGTTKFGESIRTLFGMVNVGLVCVWLPTKGVG
jgi:hypothetical protein